MPAGTSESGTWEVRYDRSPLLRAVEGPAGSLLVEGFAAREGVMTYRDSRGNVRREYVSTECLADSAGGIARCPVTLEHPDVEVDASNVDTLGVGDVDGLVEQTERGGFVRVKLAVRRKDALDAIRGGKVELSPGYRVQIDPTPGEHPVYGRYDCAQVRREYNHLAIVDTARGGPEVRLRTDSAAVATTAFSLDTGIPPASALPHRGGEPRGAVVNSRWIPILSLLGLTRRIDKDDEAFEAAEAALRARKDSDEAAAEKARQDAEKVRTDAATLQAKCDDLQRKLDEAMAENAELKKKGEEEEEKKDRAELAPLCQEYKVDAAQHPTREGLYKALATAHLGGKLRADADAAYISAVVDIAKQGLSRTDGSGRQAGREAWANQRTDSAPLQPQSEQRSDNKPRTASAHSRAQRDAAFIGNQNGGAK